MKRRDYAVGVVVILVAVLFAALPVDSPAQASLSDIPSADRYDDAVAAMAARNALGGYQPGEFQPDQPVTRGLFAEMLVRSLAANIADPSVAALDLCAAYSVTSTGAGPDMNLTHTQAISMLVRAADAWLPGVLLDPPAGWDGRLSYSDPTHGANIKRAEFNFLLDQMSLESVDLETWPSAGSTRGEAAQMLWNFLVLNEPHDPPAIITIAPSPESPSDAAVTILGSGFTQVTKVTFGGLETWFQVESDERITTAAPPPALAEAGGTVEVQVTTRFGTSAPGSQSRYSYDTHSTKPGRPAVAATDPATGWIGTVVTIRGTGFGDATGVRFGGIPAAGFTVVSPDQIQAVAPIPWNLEGEDLLPVTVTNPAGTSEPADTALFAYQVDRAPAVQVDAVNVPVLMYHYVGDTPPSRTANAEAMTVRTADFRRQMQYLADNGYQAVSFEDIYLAAIGAGALPEKPVALTFDDGGMSNYSVVFPLLREMGFTATFFVATKSVGSLGRAGWDQLREMSAAGMSIQSHTVSHHKLTATSDAQLRLELEDSRAAIMREIGRPVYVLSYPGGVFDRRVTQAAVSAGYLMAVTTDDGRTAGVESMYEISRRGVSSSTTLARFAKLLW